MELLHTRPNGAPPLHLYNKVEERKLGPLKRKQQRTSNYIVDPRENEDWIDKPRKHAKGKGLKRQRGSTPSPPPRPHRYEDVSGKRVARDEQYYRNHYHDPSTASPRLLDPVQNGKKGKAVSELKSKSNPLVLKSFLKNFLGDDLASFRDHLDLSMHKKDSQAEVTDATLQEIAELHPTVLGITADGCSEISDVGLWALAKSCNQLQKLSFANCQNITQVGLRSLSLRCQLLQEINFSGCPGVNDFGLKVLAVSCPNLQKVNVARCALLTDVSLAELGRCCPQLTHINFAWCTKLSEFGDKALVEIGKNCTKLHSLQLLGCEYVQDPGIRAISRGCQQLNNLGLGSCVELTGVAVRALAKGVPEKLSNLDLSKCTKLKNQDIWTLAESMPSLRHLNISRIKKVNIQGMRGIAEWCSRLRELNLNGMPKVNDEVLTLIANSLTVLRWIDLGSNSSITANGVQMLCNGCTILTTVELVKCKKIGRDRLVGISQSLPFVQVAKDRVALVPMENAEELICETEQYRIDTAAAILIQKMFRGVKARGGVTLLRYHAIKRFVVPKFQGLVRGHLCRQQLRRNEEARRRAEAAVVIQASFRTFKGRKLARVLRAQKRQEALELRCALKLQAVFRGWVSRTEVAGIRRQLALQAMMRYEMRQREERMALVIQRSWRAHKGYSVYIKLYREKLAREAHQKLLEESALKLQCAFRCKRARNARLTLLEAQRQAILMDKAARMVQRAYRGHQGRGLYQAMLLRQRWISEEKAAILLQKSWRGHKGRHLTAVYRSILLLKGRETRAVTVIQSWWRRLQGQQLITFMKLVKAEKELKLKSALDIQRVYRGHKGREELAVKRELEKLKQATMTLRNRQKELEEEKAELDAKYSRKAKWVDRSEEKLHSMKTEHTEVLKHRAKWYDSANISGTMQRYQTSYLVTALQMQMEELRAKVIQENKLVEELALSIRVVEKELRNIDKELIPLEQKLERETRQNRASKLYTQIRQKKSSAIHIQKVFRGHRTRSAIRKGGLYWMECFDEYTGEMYYYNTWTQESSAERPLELEILVDRSSEPTATGWVEATDSSTGYKYYYNTKTEEYRWEKPDNFDEPSEQQQTKNDDYFNSRDMAQVTARATARRKATKWVEYETEDGTAVYYYNHETGESSWDKPVEFDQSWLDTNRIQVTARSVAVRDFNNDWQELLDPDSGSTYYYNTSTGETSWSLPPSAFENGANAEPNEDTTHQQETSAHQANSWEYEEYNVNTQDLVSADDGVVHLPKEVLSSASSNPAAAVLHQNHEDNRWIEYTDENGNVFHTFEDSNEDQEHTESAKTLRGEVDLDSLLSSSISVGVVGGGWEEMLEPKNCTTYYYNADLDKVSWDPPKLDSNFPSVTYAEEETVQGTAPGGDLQPAEEEKEYIDTSSMEFSDINEVFQHNLEFNPVLGAKVDRISNLMETVNLKLRIRANELNDESEQVVLKLREQFEWLTDAIQDGSLLTAETIADKAITVLLKHDKSYKLGRAVAIS